jgi:hypothetical protein
MLFIQNKGVQFIGHNIPLSLPRRHSPQGNINDNVIIPQNGVFVNLFHKYEGKKTAQKPLSSRAKVVAQGICQLHQQKSFIFYKNRRSPYWQTPFFVI